MMKYALIVVLLVVAAILLVGIAGYPMTIYAGESIDGYTFIQPQFGRVACEPVSHTPITLTQTRFSNDNGASPVVVKFGDDENSPQGDFSFMCLEGTQFVFQMDNTPSGTNCRIGSAEWCQVQVTNKGVKIPFYSDAHLGELVAIRGCRSTYFFPVYPPEKWWTGEFYSSFVPYGLNVYDSGGAYRYNTQSCSLGDVSWADRYKVCTYNCDKNKPSSTNTLAFDDWVNYLSGYVYAPIDGNNKLAVYNGERVYCQVNSIYSLKKFETAGGKYIYADALIKAVDCCPGTQTANSLCGSDFLWHPVEVGECSANSDCTARYGQDYYCNVIDHVCIRNVECTSVLQCPGQGNWMVDYGSPESDVVRYGCTGGKCAVSERKVVACTPPNIGCADGELCDPSKGYICVKQQGPAIECGDGVCSRPFEDEVTCLKDCKVSPTDLLWLIIPVLAAIMAVLGYYSKGAVGAGLLGILGAVVGYLIFWFLTLPWWAQFLVGLGLGATGLVVTYIFGGTIATVILLLVYKAVGK